MPAEVERYFEKVLQISRFGAYLDYQARIAAIEGPLR
jgi:hypothetical protein